MKRCESDKRKDSVQKALEAHGMETSTYAFARKVANELENLKDAGTSIDSGSGGADADLWVTVGGVEYYINIRRSNNQLAKDAGIQ